MNRGIFYYLMIPLIVVACLLQATALTRFRLYGVKPDLVLLLVVVGTLIYGGRAGLLWAFLGGLGLDILSGGPFGASSLAMMMAALVAGLGHRTLSRYNLLVPLAAMALSTVVYAGAYLAILAVLQYLRVASHAMPFWPTVQNIVVPAVIYNSALIVALAPFLNRIPENQEL